MSLLGKDQEDETEAQAKRRMKLEIIRTGSCKQCGFCCPDDCPHLKNNLCEIHGRQGEFCSECNDTHQICVDAPPFPMRKGNPDCGFRFLVKGTDLEAIEILCCKAE